MKLTIIHAMFERHNVSSSDFCQFSKNIQYFSWMDVRVFHYIYIMLHDLILCLTIMWSLNLTGEDLTEHIQKSVPQYDITTVTMKYSQGHWKLYEWIKPEKCYHTIMQVSTLMMQICISCKKVVMFRSVPWTACLTLTKYTESNFPLQVNK